MDNPQIIAERMKQLCDEQKVSVNKAGIDSGAGGRIYYNMLGGSYPSIEKAEQLANYFNISVDYLIGRTDKKELNITKESDGIIIMNTKPDFTDIENIMICLNFSLVIDELQKHISFKIPRKVVDQINTLNYVFTQDVVTELAEELEIRSELFLFCLEKYLNKKAIELFAKYEHAKNKEALKGDIIECLRQISRENKVVALNELLSSKKDLSSKEIDYINKLSAFYGFENELKLERKARSATLSMDDELDTAAHKNISVKPITDNDNV